MRFDDMSSLFYEPAEGPFCEDTDLPAAAMPDRSCKEKPVYPVPSLPDCGCGKKRTPAPAPQNRELTVDDCQDAPNMTTACGCPTVPAVLPGAYEPELPLEPDALYEYVDDDYGEVAACWYIPQTGTQQAADRQTAQAAADDANVADAPAPAPLPEEKPAAPAAVPEKQILPQPAEPAKTPATKANPEEPAPTAFAPAALPDPPKAKPAPADVPAAPATEPADAPAPKEAVAEKASPAPAEKAPAPSRPVPAASGWASAVPDTAAHDPRAARSTSVWGSYTAPSAAVRPTASAEAPKKRELWQSG